MNTLSGDFGTIEALVLQKTGLRLDQNRFTEVTSIIEQLAQINEKTPRQIIGALRDLPVTDSAWQTLMRTLTINETYFFRNKSQFIALREHLLPALIAARRMSGQRFIRFWSAGCATGEEPYSLAILLRELLPDIDEWLITILATDINMSNLENARQGIYKTHAFRGETPEHLRDRWFTPVKSGHELDPVIRRMVNFKHLNLIADEYPSYDNNTMNFDLIMCRNVTIYFNREQTATVIGRLGRALIGGGWLVVGHAEPQPVIYDAFETVHLEGTVLYRKPGIGSPMARPTVSPPIAAPVPTPAPIPAEAIVDTNTKPEPARPAENSSYDRARDAANREDWIEALNILKAFTQEEAMQPQVHYLRALVQLHQGEALQAMESLRQAIYCDPGFALAHYTLGDHYARDGKFKDALRHWTLAERALDQLDENAQIDDTGELTVEMLRALLAYRRTHIGSV